jgi:PucR family transcriptional regulator, purine catabolism regulatory protein
MAITADDQALRDALDLSETILEALKKPDRIVAILRVLERRGLHRGWIALPDGTIVHCGEYPPSAELVQDGWTQFAELPAGSVVETSQGDTAVLPIAGVDRVEALLGATLSPELGWTRARALASAVIPYLALEIAHRRALRDTERRFGAELVDLAMAGGGEVEATKARLLALELDPAGPLLALLVGWGGGQDRPARVEAVLARLGLRAVVALRRGCIIVVAQTPEDADALAIGRAVMGRIEEAGAIGVGSIVPGVRGLRRTLVEADYAYRVACSRPADQQIASYHDIGSHSLLLDLHDDEVVRAFCLAVLQPLIEHDRERHVQLLETVKTFLESGCQWQATATHLQVHVNTLRHRIGRVEQLTGRDLASMDDRVDLFVALRGHVRLAVHDSAAI